MDAPCELDNEVFDMNGQRRPRTFANIVQHGHMPSKREVLVAESVPAPARRGQVMILFAGFLLALMGALGLATDVGYAMAARRAAQGAADAGAIAGARMIARHQPSATTSAQADVNAVVAQNTFGPVTPTVTVCQYIGNNWSVVGTCNQTVPSNAAGVRVRTRLTVNTFFIHLVPGAPRSYNVGGYAKARVQSANVASLAAQSPFIICGDSAWDVTSNPTAKSTSVGSNMAIFSSKSPFRINQNAVGRIFRVHDSQLDKKGNADCSSHSDRFKGLADQADNAGRTAPGWFSYYMGEHAGPTRVKVNGTEGCGANVASPYNCVMLIPVATNNPAESNNSKQLYIVGYAAFRVTRVDANTHNAQLLDDYIISGTNGTDTWCRECGGVVVIRLIW
jgi:Flp pilus assembly protein TadG